MNFNDDVQAEWIKLGIAGLKRPVPPALRDAIDVLIRRSFKHDDIMKGPPCLA